MCFYIQWIENAVTAHLSLWPSQYTLMNLNSDHLKSTVSEQIGYESSFVSLFGAFFFLIIIIYR